MREITYAKSGGPPDDWCGLRVFDLDSGIEVQDVEEVNAAEGWLVRYTRDEHGNLVLNEFRDEVSRERVKGRFEIRFPA